MANKALISNPIGKHIILYKNGNTDDIVNSVMWADMQPEHKESLKNFAPGLKGNNDVETCYNIWKWTKENIKYILDPPYKQYIKSPAQTIADGYADCKSRSIFMTSALLNANKIPYSYRFVSYSGGLPYTHVYIIARLKNGWYAMDPDMPAFNKQKFTTCFIDKPMSEIHYIAGAKGKTKLSELHAHHQKALLEKFGMRIKPLDPKDPRFTEKLARRHHLAGTPDMQIHKPCSEMTDLDWEIAIRKHRHMLNKHIVDGKKGIGSAHSEKAKDVIDAFDDAQYIMKQPDLDDAQKISGLGLIIDDFKNGKYNSSATVAGIGNISERNDSREYIGKARKGALKERAKKVGTKIKAKAKADKGKAKGLFKKIAKGVTKVAKGVMKAIKSVANAPLNIIMRVTLPKAADYFIYLFIKKKEIIAKLPDSVRRKRKTSEVIAKFITHTAGMKEDKFMGIIRNGIMKKHHKSPEKVLQESLKMNISGIGSLEDAEIGIIDDIVQVIFSVLKQIAKLFKKKIPKEAEDGLNAKDATPNIANDFAEAGESLRKEIGQEVVKQVISPEEKAASDSGFVLPDSSGTQLPTRMRSPEQANNSSNSNSSKEPTDQDKDVAAVEEVFKDTPVDGRKTKAC